MRGKVGTGVEKMVALVYLNLMKLVMLKDSSCDFLRMVDR